MTRPAPTYQFHLKPWHLLLAVTAIQLIVALLTYSFTFTHEEAMWHYIGRNWFRHGLTPYTGGVDNKSPLIFAIYGLSDWLFGVNYWFPRILGTVVEATGIWYLFKIARHYAGERAGLFALSLYGLSLCWKMTGGKMVSFTETYATTFIIIAFYHGITASKDKSCFIAGLLAGLGCCFRVSAIFGLLAVFITCIRRGWAAAFTFIAGVCLAGSLFVAFCWLTRVDIQDLLRYGIVDNFGPGSTTDHALHWKVEQFTNNFFYSELVLFYPLVAGYFLLYRKIDAPAIWLICIFIGINALGIYADPHFKELLPAFSVVGALTLAALTDKYQLPFTGLLIVVWLCFFPKVLEPFWGIKRLVSSPSVAPSIAGSIEPEESACDERAVSANDEAEKQLGLWIKANTRPTDLVYVAGHGARVQAYSERRSPTDYFNVTQTAEARRHIFVDIARNKPSMLVVPLFADYNRYVVKSLRDHIKMVTREYYTFQRCLYGYAIYSRNAY